MQLQNMPYNKLFHKVNQSAIVMHNTAHLLNAVKIKCINFQINQVIGFMIKARPSSLSSMTSFLLIKL